MKIKQTDFPILQQDMNQQPLLYLDSAATTQKPKPVLQALATYYTQDNANVHRGIYALSQRATLQYEQARDKVQGFIHAKQREEILFTRGTTEAINWVASTYGMENVGVGDEIVITYMEHHSNIVPWQQLAKRVGATLKYIALTNDGLLDMADARKQVTSRTKIVAVTHVSNVLGVCNPIRELADLAHAQQAIILVDGAQSTPHMAINVQDLSADFFVFSGHKMLGPMGIGVLYGKARLLSAMSPAQFGGEMIDIVDDQDATFQPLPWRFEAGTPNVAGAIGLGAAIDYLSAIGLDNVTAYEHELVTYALAQLKQVPGLIIYGPQDSDCHMGVIAFNLQGIHPHDVATALDQEGIAVRAGHHCAQPLMRQLKVAATVRVSLYIYNNRADIDRLVHTINEIKDYFEYGLTSTR